MLKQETYEKIVKRIKIHSGRKTGLLTKSVPEIAEKANVSIRSVYRAFDMMIIAKLAKRDNTPKRTFRVKK